MPTADEIINAYVRIRDQKKELTDRHKQELAPFNEKLGKLEAGLLSILSANGSESIKSKAGTAYITERTSVKTQDWDTFLPFCLENNLEHMLVQSAAKQSVLDYVEANGELPPGLTMSTDLAVNVRRSSK